MKKFLTIAMILMTAIAFGQVVIKPTIEIVTPEVDIAVKGVVEITATATTTVEGATIAEVGFSLQGYPIAEGVVPVEGVYSVSIDASEFDSGIYTIAITAKDSNDVVGEATRKVVVNGKYSAKTLVELEQMLKTDVDELKALAEIAYRNDVTLDHFIWYAQPVTPEKFAKEIVDQMIRYFNAIDWYRIYEGDPKRIRDVCQKVLIVVPVTKETGHFLSIVKTKKELME